MSLSKAVLSLSTLAVLSLSVAGAAAPSQTSENQGNTFLAIPAPAVLANLKTSVTDKKLVQGYITHQIALHNLTSEQFVALTPPQQQRVLSPGRTPLSREERRAIVLKRNAVPTDVVASIVPMSSIPEATLNRFAVQLPTSMQKGLSLPSGAQVLLIGQKLVVVSRENTVLEVLSERI